MADAVTMTFDSAGVMAGLDALLAGVKEQVRPSAQAGAQALYDEVKLNASRRTKSGLLASAIYQVYSKDNSKDGKAVYHVSWNYKKAPHGHLIENGTSRSPAYPFLRPAYDTKKGEALNAANARMAAGVTRVIEGLK